MEGEKIEGKMEPCVMVGIEEGKRGVRSVRGVRGVAVAEGEEVEVEGRVGDGEEVEEGGGGEEVEEEL